MARLAMRAAESWEVIDNPQMGRCEMLRTAKSVTRQRAPSFVRELWLLPQLASAFARA
jgi:hypothetical protein